MNKIECGVGKCSHNRDSLCFAKRVNIGGKSLEGQNVACCGSFLNEILYGDLSNSVGEEIQPCDSLICHTKSCRNNDNSNSLCSLDSIQVNANVNITNYAETGCSSFEEK